VHAALDVKQKKLILISENEGLVTELSRKRPQELNSSRFIHKINFNLAFGNFHITNKNSNL